MRRWPTRSSPQPTSSTRDDADFYTLNADRSDVGEIDQWQFDCVVDNVPADLLKRKLEQYTGSSLGTHSSKPEEKSPSEKTSLFQALAGRALLLGKKEQNLRKDDVQYFRVNNRVKSRNGGFFLSFNLYRTDPLDGSLVIPRGG